MRYVGAALIFLLVCLVPLRRGQAEDRKLTRERIFLSRTCRNSAWYLVASDEETVTVECDTDP